MTEHTTPAIRTESARGRVKFGVQIWHDGFTKYTSEFSVGPARDGCQQSRSWTTFPEG